MQVNSFLDIKALGTSKEDMPESAILAKAMHILHGAFATNDARYAISFPHSKQGKKRSMGSTIRVFAESSASLYALIEKVKGHHLMRDYVGMSMPKEVPENFLGTWSTWQRVQIQKKAGVNREKALLRAKEAIFFEMRSSSGNVFPLRVHRSSGVAHKEKCSPSSYGFASWDNLFSLPDVA